MKLSKGQQRCAIIIYPLVRVAEEEKPQYLIFDSSVYQGHETRQS
jgi:hypothetical protein